MVWVATLALIVEAFRGSNPPEVDGMAVVITTSEVVMDIMLLRLLDHERDGNRAHGHSHGTSRLGAEGDVCHRRRRSFRHDRGVVGGAIIRGTGGRAATWPSSTPCALIFAVIVFATTCPFLNG